MNHNDKRHPFDIATNLSLNNGIYYGKTTKHYANMVGPFGGIIAATLLKAVLEHPERKGEPITLTINYAAPVSDGDFTIKATPARTNRSTQHWFIELTQGSNTVITGTAILANRRKTWSATEVEFPRVPSVDDVKQIPLKGLPAWVHNYDMRIVQGAPDLSKTNNVDNSDSVTIQWIRDEPKRQLDFLSLAAICDAFFPRIFVKRNQLLPIGTVSLTIYFHVDSETLAEHGERELLGNARALKFRDSFFDQTAEIWTPEGNLLAVSSQLVYFNL